MCDCFPLTSGSVRSAGSGDAAAPQPPARRTREHQRTVLQAPASSAHPALPGALHRATDRQTRLCAGTLVTLDDIVVVAVILRYL